MTSINQIGLEESFKSELSDARMTNSDVLPGPSSGVNSTINSSGSSSSGTNGSHPSNTMGSGLFDLKEDKTLNDVSSKNQGESMMDDADIPGPVDEEEMKRSIYIGNVDYGTKLTELQDLFKTCGSINRITIMNDKRTGMPKGFAYLEFCEPEAVETALKFDGAMFRGRQIKVSTKRKNIPGYNRGRGVGPGGGGGFRGGMMRGGFRGYPRGGMMPGGYGGGNFRGYYGHPYKSYRGGGAGGYSGNRHYVNPY